MEHLPATTPPLDCPTGQMRAIVCSAYGSPDVLSLRHEPIPETRDDGVRVRVHATTVTAACGMMRRGDTVMARVVLGLRKPRKRYRVMGIELAGEIEQVGRGVTRFRPGDRVFGFAGFAVGAYAQLCCLPAHASIALMPTGLSYEEAASLVDGPTTALYFLRDRARIRPGEKVLIVGASGSIGTAAVQLARHFGAEVTGVCSRANEDLVRSLGAHHIIDYTKEDFVMGPQTYDLIFDTVGKSSFSRCKRVLNAGGRYLLTVAGLRHYLLAAWTRLFSDKRVVLGMSVEKREALEVIGQLYTSGVLRPVIDRRYPLEEIAKAHHYVEGGHKKGNVVITVAHA